MEKKYHGIIPPIATPVDKHENVEESAFRSLIDYCIAGGLHGIFVAGTNGETMQLTQRERNHAIQICVDQVNGRVPVIAGCMDTSTRRVIENIKAAEDLGAACVAVTPIFYDRHTSQNEITRHFERILQETSCEIMIYNIPPFTGEKIAPKTVIEIAQMDRRVVGYKDSSGAFGEFMQVLSVYRDTPFSVMQGVTPCALPAILMGADGFVPALAPAFPEMFVSAYKAAKSKDCDLAWRYQEVIEILQDSWHDQKCHCRLQVCNLSAGTHGQAGNLSPGYHLPGGRSPCAGSGTKGGYDVRGAEIALCQGMT